MVIVLLFTSCEDVVDVDLNDAEPRLVIETNITISEENGSMVSKFIRLTTTAPYFDDDVPPVEDAIVEIHDENGNIYPFPHSEEGYYFGNLPVQHNQNYTLQIVYDDEVYRGTTKLVGVSPLEYVEQKDDGGFFGDKIELRVFFTDPAGEDNFYFFLATSERGVRRSVYKDEFFDGNETFASYMPDDLEAGDMVQFSLFGISEDYYNYMFILLQQTGGGGGPFETQPATVRGNIVNETNPENFPLGYFRISEVSILDYEVE